MEKEIPIRYCRMWHHRVPFPVSWSHNCSPCRASSIILPHTTVHHCDSQYIYVLHSISLCFTVHHRASQYISVLHRTSLSFKLIFRQVWAHPCLFSLRANTEGGVSWAQVRFSIVYKIILPILHRTGYQLCAQMIGSIVWIKIQPNLPNLIIQLWQHLEEEQHYL